MDIKDNEISKIAKYRLTIMCIPKHYTFPCVYCVNQVFWHDNRILSTELEKQRMTVTVKNDIRRVEWTGTVNE
jgi:hypothetical protein